MVDVVLGIAEDRVRLHADFGEFEWALGDELVEIARDPTGLHATDVIKSLDFDVSWQQRTEVGLRLHDAVFGAAPKGLWEGLQRDMSERDPLRVRLDIEPRALVALPWELMRDKRQALWRNSRVLLRRGRRVGGPGNDLREEGPLRVLLVVCNPRDPGLLADQELAMIGAALTELPGRVHTEVVDGPGLRELITEVGHVRPHVLHFIGHGMRAVAGDQGGLHFNAAQPDADSPAPAPERDSWTLGPDQMRHLYDVWKPRLVVLNVCRRPGDPAAELGGLVETCLDRGSSAVVAMQPDVDSPAVAEFSYALYRDLARSRPLDAAVTAARNHLHVLEPGGPSWALPVLHCGVGDPRDVARVAFGDMEPELTRMNRSWPFTDLTVFLGRD
ncbi:CHAT domain-containing protein, partial [Streptomyces sp. KL109B]